MIQTEVLVIGAGPGGYVASIKLGKLGKKTLLVEEDGLGGECLNYGCIPSKALISASNVVHKIRTSEALGIQATDWKADLSQIQNWRKNLVGGFHRGIASLLKGNGVEFLSGRARFTGPRSVEVKTPTGTEVVEFQKAILATGSKPIEVAGFPIDSSAVLSSRQALELQSTPKSLFIIGAGVIGMEIGTFYAKLGTKVVFVEMLGQILPGIDPELARPVSRALQKLGAEVYLESRAKGYKKDEKGLIISWTTQEGEREEIFEKILLSVGRRPNTEHLGLDAAGVLVDPKGFVSVNERYQTSSEHIYAVGDMIGPPFLAHKASREGILAALSIADRKLEPIGAVPWAIFSEPEVSFVGMTEAEARLKGIEIAIGRFPFSASGRAQAARETEGFVKVIIEKGSARILGVGIVGPEASDLISEAALALRLKATAHDVASTIHPHPTLSETFMEACEAALGESIHLPNPSRRGEPR